MSTLGSRIKELRLERKMTGDELGRVLGISKSTISLYEHDKSTPDDAIKKKIAYVPDSPDLFLNLTANDYWYFLTRIYDLEASQVEERLTNLMATFDLTESRYNLISSFSHGMRQKVVVIGALLVNPQIWVLDEPLTGLDPQASYDLKEAMRHHAKEGNSVLFSTHVLSVAEQLCNRIAILKKGKLIFQGSLAELKSQYPDKDLETIYLEMAGRKIEEV